MSSVMLLAVARVIVSACLTAIEPAARSLLPDTLRKEQIEKGIAFQEVITQLIQVIVPLVTGVLFSFLHFGWLWVLCGSLSFLSIFWSGESKIKGAAKSVFLLQTNNCSAVLQACFKISRSSICCMGRAYSSLYSAVFQYISSFGPRYY